MDRLHCGVAAGDAELRERLLHPRVKLVARLLIVRSRRLGTPFRTMASGAGHDTATLAGQGVPSTMIFIRNQNGSHNPDEAMRIEDLCAAATLVAHLVAEA